MFGDTRIDKKVDIEEFVKLIRKHSEEKIGCTSHTFFRLSQKQREIFTCEVLKKILMNEKPFLAGFQYNGNHAVFYNYKNKFLKMILNIEIRKINIVTFYFIQQWQIPKI